MNTVGQLEHVRQLLRTISDIAEEPSAAATVEQQIDVLDRVAAADLKPPEDDDLAVYGAVANLDSALDQLDEMHRHRLERDNDSVLHDVGRLQARVFRQPSFTRGDAGGPEITAAFVEAVTHCRGLSEAIRGLLDAEPGMEGGLRDALRGWLRRLDFAESEVRRQLEYDLSDTAIMAPQTVSETCVHLAKVAWPALVIFAYGANRRDPNADAEARGALIAAARNASRYITTAVG